MFTKDLVFPPSTRNGEASITHAVAAVGSRSLAKAEEFIVANCPRGAAGQVEGHVPFKPRAYGSYKEVIADEVRLAFGTHGFWSWACWKCNDRRQLTAERQHRLCRDDEHLSLRRRQAGARRGQALSAGEGALTTCSSYARADASRRRSTQRSGELS